MPFQKGNKLRRIHTEQSEESKRKISEIHKRLFSEGKLEPWLWDKGKTKENTPQLQKQSDMMKGNKLWKLRKK